MYIVGFFYIIGYDARYKQCQIQNIHVLLLMKALRVYMCLRMDIFFVVSFNSPQEGNR